MFNILASAFAAISILWAGLFGAGLHATSTPSHAPFPMATSTRAHFPIASSTFPGFPRPGGGYGSTTPMMRPVVVSGTVATVNGDTLTVNGRQGLSIGPIASSSNSANPTTYTVDATNARVFVRGSATSTVASISVGDRVVVAGSVASGSTTSITARYIADLKGLAFPNMGSVQRFQGNMNPSNAASISNDGGANVGGNS